MKAILFSTSSSKKLAGLLACLTGLITFAFTLSMAILAIMVISLLPAILFVVALQSLRGLVGLIAGLT